MSSIIVWCNVGECAYPRRLWCIGCRKWRTVTRSDGLAILRAWPTSLGLIWQRAVDRADVPVLLVNTALEIRTRNWAPRTYVKRYLITASRLSWIAEVNGRQSRCTAVWILQLIDIGQYWRRHSLSSWRLSRV